MAFTPKTVREAILYEYAKLVADAAVGGRPQGKPHPRTGSEYWSFATSVFRKLNTEELSPSSLLRENKLLVSTGQECAYCGAVGELQWEHLFPRSLGGPDTIDNLVLSCAPCNSKKGALNPVDWYWKRGIHRRSIPRLVMGKCLKLILTEHQRRGTLDAKEFPVGAGLHMAGVFRVFEPPVSE